MNIKYPSLDVYCAYRLKQELILTRTITEDDTK